MKERFLRLRVSAVGRWREVHGQQRKRGSKFDERRHLRIKAVIPASPDAVAVVEVVCFIPGGGVEAGDVNELQGEDEEERGDEQPLQPHVCALVCDALRSQGAASLRDTQGTCLRAGAAEQAQGSVCGWEKGCWA